MDTFCMEYEFTKKDYINAIEKDLEKSKHMVWIVPVVVIIIILFIIGILVTLQILEETPGKVQVPFLIALPIIGILLAIMFRRRNRATRILKNRIRRGEVESQYFGRHRLELKADVIELKYGTICIQRSYVTLLKTVEYSSGILIYNNQKEMVVIPFTAFEDVKQREEFLIRLQAKIAPGVSNQDIEEHKKEADYVLEYSWDEKSYVAALVRAERLTLTTRLGWSTEQIICTLMGFLFIILSIIFFIRDMMPSREIDIPILGMVCMMVGVAFTSPLIVIFTPAAGRMQRQRIENGIIPRDHFGPQVVCFKEDRITELRRLNSNELMYDCFYCVKLDENGMYLLAKGRRFFPIPNAAFGTDNHKQEMANYIENKIRENQNEKTRY